MQLRLKMTLPTKSSKWTITNLSFFMRAFKWRRNLWQTSLWSCLFYVMMCLEWHLRHFLPFSFICCLFVCISLHAHIEDNVHFKYGVGLTTSSVISYNEGPWKKITIEEGLEKKLFVLCFFVFYFYYFYCYFCFCILF